LKLKITVDGKVYEVDVEVAENEPPRPSYLSPATPTRVSAARPAAGPPPLSPPGKGEGARAETVKDEGKVCRSPISGVVVRVSAQDGQTIQTNDVLMVLEAMKMETSITSPISGKVAKVNVHVGDAVQGGQVLVEFD
jgi:methylmalonyl-CoA carboxyltransferase small subunit